MNNDWDQIADAWENTDVAYIEGLADGEYQAEVVMVELVTSKSGNLMLKWVLEVKNPPYVGFKITKFSMLPPNPAILVWFKADLAKIGVEMKHPALLEDPAFLETLLGHGFDVELKSKPDNNGEMRQNVRFMNGYPRGGPMPWDGFKPVKRGSKNKANQAETPW